MKPVLVEEFKHISDYESSVFHQLIAMKNSLFVHDNKVVKVKSHKYTGVNKHSNKRYFRWETVRSEGLRRNNNGTIIPINVSIDGNNIQPAPEFGHGVFNIFNRDKEMANNFDISYQSALKETFNITSIYDVYPMLKPYNTLLTEVPRGMTGHFRTSTPQEFVRSIFGNDNYRRDLVKAACNATPPAIALAKEFKGLVPIDWIINFLRISTSMFKDGYNMKMKSLLVQLDPRSYRHVLKDDDMNALRYASDIAGWMAYRRQREPIRLADPVRVKSFMELHDYIIGGNVEYRPLENKPIALTETAKKLDGLLCENMVFVPAKNTCDMATWGETMRNCIASYADKATSGKGVYAAVTRDNKVVANLEIVNNKLIQLLGKFNQSLEGKTRTSIVNTLVSQGVDCSGNWWGRE